MHKLLTTLLLILPFCFNAQENAVIDSLMNQLETSTDTLHYQSLRALSKEYAKTDLDMAMNYAVQCLSYAKEMNYEEGITTATMLVGNTYTRKGEYETGITYYIDASEMATQSKDTFLISQAYNNIGAIQFYIDNYEKAIEYFKKAQQIKSAIGTPKQIASGLSNIGEAYRKLEELDSAINYLNRAYQIFKEIENVNGLATTLNNIGNIHAQKNDYTKAIEFYEKSLPYKYEMNKPRDLAIACSNLGEMYYELHQYDKALKYYLTSEKYVLESQSLIDIKTTYKGLAKVYEQKKNWQKSLSYFKQYSAISDSLLNIEKANSVADFEAKYQSIEKEKEIVQLGAEKEKEQLIREQKELEVIKIQKEKDLEAKESEFKTTVIISTVVVLILLAMVVLIALKRNKERKRDNEALTTKNHEIEEKNKEIMDSINYAKRIQNAILPPNKIVKEYLHDSFILYKPKDIVAGDFYWLEHKNGKTLFAAADCTGHGVPGAMVSVVCNNGLNRSVREHGITDPGKILDKTREIIIQEFEKSEDEVKDGMDIALCSLEGMKLEYAGAHNPLWIVRNGEVLETKANKQPIGKFDDLLPYTTHSFELQQGDAFYIFSDGYVDQFGGKKGKKFKAKALRELIVSIQDKSMTEQSKILDSTFEEWKGDLEQIDDVCVIGVKV